MGCIHVHSVKPTHPDTKACKAKAFPAVAKTCDWYGCGEPLQHFLMPYMQASQSTKQRCQRLPHQKCLIASPGIPCEDLIGQPFQTRMNQSPQALVKLCIKSSDPTSQESCSRKNAHEKCRTGDCRPPSWRLTREELLRRPTLPSGAVLEDALCMKRPFLGVLKT
jgi:hypothetical protein